MEKILSKFSQIPQPAISGYIENIKSDHLFLLSYTQDRLDLLNSNYLKRLYKIYLFAFKKKYYSTLGWKSFVADLIFRNNN